MIKVFDLFILKTKGALLRRFSVFIKSQPAFFDRLMSHLARQAEYVRESSNGTYRERHILHARYSHPFHRF